ncbi:MAG: rpsI [Ignavibacteria bacterium]|nr:rpsI [Ignavibacteria bacterium]
MKVYRATGRRKTSVAQVRLTSPGNGKLTVNKQPLEKYLQVEVNTQKALLPLVIAKFEGKFDVSVSTCGGGLSGQTGAIQLGIARALLQYDETLRASLRDYGLLTRDPRMVERKKYGQKKARKRFQFSKR